MISWGHFSEAVIDRIQSGVILLDVDGNIADINQFAVNLFAIEKAAWVGRAASELFPALDLTLIRQALTEKVTIRIDELLFQLNRKELSLSAEASPLIVLGQAVGTILTFQDRTESLRVRKDIIDAEKIAAIGNMAAGTVHEIRNPLTTIKGFLQLFQRDIKKMSGMGLVQKNFADKSSNIFPLLFSEIIKIEQILSDFLLISKPQELHFKVIRIHELLDEIMPQLQAYAMQYNVSIVCELPRKNIKFFGDPNEVASVVMNLVQNAVEAVQSNGEIRLSVEVLEESFRLIVQDNGSGIPDDQLPIVFDPFITTKPDRPGLGLSVCQQVMVRMGGTISISSEMGKGTTVEIDIPCLREDILSLDDIRPALKEAAYR